MHAESVWHEAAFLNSPAESGYFGDGNSTGNGGIRGATGIAVAYAVLVRAFPRDPRTAIRLEHIRKTLNYAANTHLSGPPGEVCLDGKRWGHLPGHGQTGLWGAQMGLACLLVQDQLPATTVAACQRAVADEATFQASQPPGNGYVNDTQAEENAWNSNIQVLGAAWMPRNTNAAFWLTGAKRFLANSYTVANTNGDPLAPWISTVTLYPSYGVENHGFYHPSYQNDPGCSMGISYFIARIANPKIAAELRPFAEHNVLKVWEHLSHVLLDSGEFAYPSGLDWSLHSYEQIPYLAYLTAHFNDPLGRWAEAQLLKLIRYRQQLNGDGRFIGESLPNGFYHEAVDAQAIAFAWLHHQYDEFPTGPASPPTSCVAVSDDIKLITQRSPAGFVSVCYGPRIMALIEPPAGAIPEDPFVTTPRFPGLIGIGALGKPQKARLLSLETNATGFEAHLSLAYAKNGTTQVYFKSVGNAVAIVEVPQPAAGVKETEAPSFSMGIENHALTGGKRLLVWENGHTNIVERSGTTIRLTNQWVCVSDRQGMIAGPDGQMCYRAASRYLGPDDPNNPVRPMYRPAPALGYNRLGAAEDTLEFLPSHSLAPHYAVIWPGASAAKTAAAAGRVRWQLNSTNAVLSFPAGDGSIHELKIQL